MYNTIEYTGLNSWLSDAWGWCKQKAKTKLGKLIIGTVATSLFGGVVGGIIYSLLAPLTDLANTFNITDKYQPKSEKEFKAIEFWNENLYIPFLQKIEELITGTNAQKNQALSMMSIYENTLKEHLLANKPNVGMFELLTDSMSYDCLLHRYVYVLDIHNEIRSMLTITPSQKIKIETSTYLQEFKNIFNSIAFTEINHIPTKTEVLLLPADAPVVDINLNNPIIKDQTEDLTTKAITPITGDGKNIAETLTDIIKTNDRDVVKIEITDKTKNPTEPKEVVTITEATNTDGTKTQEVATEVTNPDGTKNQETTTTITETQKNKSPLFNTVKQAVVFATVAVLINKITKSK